MGQTCCIYLAVLSWRLPQAKSSRCSVFTVHKHQKKVKTPCLSNLVSAFDLGIWMRAEFVQSDLYKSTQFVSLIHLHLSNGFSSHSKVMPKSSMIHFPLTASFNPHSSLSFLILPSAFLLGHLCIYSSLYLKHTHPQTLPRLTTSSPLCPSSNASQ